jgi:hypothetical protein
VDHELPVRRHNPSLAATWQKSEDGMDGMQHVEDMETQAEPRPGSLVVREEEEEETE